MALTGLLKSSAATLLTTVAVTALGFVASVISARLLGPEGRGLLSAALLIAMLAANASLLGLANSFIYHQGAGRRFAYGRLMLLSLPVIAALALLLAWLGLHASEAAALRRQWPLLLATAAAMAGQGYFYALSQRHDDLRFFNLMRVLLVAGNLALLLLLAAAGRVGFAELLAAQLLVALLLTGLGIAWACRHRVWRAALPAQAEAVGWTRVLGYGASYHGTVLLSLLLVNVDKLALLRLGSIVEFGFYALAFTTSRLIGAVQEALSTALYARFAGKDAGELSRSVNGAFRLTFVPMLGVAATGAALAPWLISGVYGSAFAPMAAPFAILLFECVITGASWMLAQRFNAGGRPGLVLARQCVSVVPVLAALPLLPAHDLALHLSLLMLAGALLRLAATLALYPLSLGERMPRLLPTAADGRALAQGLARLRPARQPV